MTKTKAKKTSKAKAKATNKSDATTDSDEELGDLEDDALDGAPADIASAEPDKDGEDGESDGTDGSTTTKDNKRPGDDDDDEDEPDPDDVEADLDTILKDRIASADDEDDEEDGAEFGSSAGARTPPKTESEFVCTSCFLVKSVTQRVDGSDDLCMDCV